MPTDIARLWELVCLRAPSAGSLHGVAHWRRVEANGVAIARASGADETFVRAFAALHDACRLNEGHDPDHGRRAADLARTLQGDVLDFPPAKFEDLLFALTHHDQGKTSSDPNIGACWDADRLDLPRVGITPEARFFSTEEGRRLCGVRARGR
jgi:uncharacterized protein